MTEIPKGDFDSQAPCWIAVVDSTGTSLKPLIKCQCGKICGIGLHHVHADGTITASFFHSTDSSFVHNGKTYTHEPGCGWHVFLKLLDYKLGDFPPDALENKT